MPTTYNKETHTSTTHDKTNAGYGILCNNEDILCNNEDYDCHGAVVMRDILQGSQNVCLWSREFETSPWVTVNSPILTQDQTGFDGTANKAWTVEDDSNTSFEYSYQIVTISDDNNTHCVSFFIKKTSGATSFPGFALRFIGGSNKNSGITVNTNDGTIVDRTGFSPIDSGIIDYNSDYYRVWLAYSNDNSGNIILYFYVYSAVNNDASGTWSNTATGSIILDGVQIELNRSSPNTFFETEDRPLPSTGAIDTTHNKITY